MQRTFMAAVVGALVACASAASGQRGYPARPIEGEAAISDLNLMQRVLEVIHPGYTRFTDQAVLDEAFDALRTEVADGTTDERMYLGISRVLEKIRCDHTKAELPTAMREWRETNPSFIPVRLHIFGDALYAGTNLVEGLGRGSRVLRINGIEAARLIAEIEALVPIDGYTDHARAAEAELSSEFMGSGIDTFMPLLHGWSSEFVFDVESTNGVRTVAGDAITYAEFEAMVISGEDYPRDFKDAVSVERLSDSTALLRVDTFVNYREPVDPDEVYAAAIRPLNAEGVEHLIVDIRANGGGSTDALVSLFRHLIAEPVTVRTGGVVKTVPIPQDVKDAVTTWDRSVLEISEDMVTRNDAGEWVLPDTQDVTVEPSPDHFRGRVTALSSRANASGSTLLLSALQSHAGVRIVGEPTGGSVEGPTAGTILFCDLPASGIRVRVPAVKSITGLSPERPGMGVTPDVPANITPEAFFAGRDEVLEAALSE